MGRLSHFFSLWFLPQFASERCEAHINEEDHPGGGQIRRFARTFGYHSSVTYATLDQLVGQRYLSNRSLVPPWTSGISLVMSSFVYFSWRWMWMLVLRQNCTLDPSLTKHVPINAHSSQIAILHQTIYSSSQFKIPTSCTLLLLPWLVIPHTHLLSTLDILGQ